jgi:hypothetical protein
MTACDSPTTLFREKGIRRDRLRMPAFSLPHCICPCHFLPLFPGFMGNKRIIMDEEEVVAEVECDFCSINTRRPYGVLGSVDTVKYIVAARVSVPTFPRTFPSLLDGDLTMLVFQKLWRNSGGA